MYKYILTLGVGFLIGWGIGLTVGSHTINTASTKTILLDYHYHPDHYKIDTTYVYNSNGDRIKINYDVGYIGPKD